MKRAINTMTVIFMIVMVVNANWAYLFGMAQGWRIFWMIFDTTDILLVSWYYTFVDKTSPFYWKELLKDE